MAGPHRAIAATRVAVRQALREIPQLKATTQVEQVKLIGQVEQVEYGDHARRNGLVLVACSGGADSLALAAAVAFEAPRMGMSAGAVIVDHDLQDGSRAVAERAADQCRGLGLDPVEVVTVQVEGSARDSGAGSADGPAGGSGAGSAGGSADGAAGGSGDGSAGGSGDGSGGGSAGGPGAGAGSGAGPESRARDARYRAFEEVRKRAGATAVLLGHTRDDQAEQVLLGLARGSGARSLAGMPARRGRYFRPLLGVARTTTRAACEAAGLEPWVDPHNSDPAYGRVRARALLPVLEAELGPGTVAALARCADLLRQDADALDDLASQARSELSEVGARGVQAAALQRLPTAVRTRVWRLLALEAGCRPGALTATHIDSLDTLVTSWRGQGPIDLPGHVQGRRSDGRVLVASIRQVE